MFIADMYDRERDYVAANAETLGMIMKTGQRMSGSQPDYEQREFPDLPSEAVLSPEQQEAAQTMHTLAHVMQRHYGIEHVSLQADAAKTTFRTRSIDIADVGEVVLSFGNIISLESQAISGKILSIASPQNIHNADGLTIAVTGAGRTDVARLRRCGQNAPLPKRLNLVNFRRTLANSERRVRSAL